MRAQVASTNITILIDGYQIDIFYFFITRTMQIFVEGQLITDTIFEPARHTFNYVNMSDIAAKTLNFYLKYHAH